MFKTPQFWRSKNLIAITLLPLSLLYWLCSLIRKNIASPYTSKGKVISIGNNIVGGSGKTSIVIEICQILQKKSVKFCAVTYGPGGKMKGPELIRKDSTPQEAGDEALMLAQYCPTIVSKDKSAGVRLGDQMGFDYIIVDDGLQNPNFIKDLNICVYNPRIANNGFIFPAGPNRESLESSLKKSQILIIFGKMNSALSSHTKLSLTAEKKFTPNLNGKKVIAFCSIANPSLFIEALEKNGASVVKCHEFPDHHIYTQRDLDFLFTTNQKEVCVTTYKDYVKLPSIYKAKVLVLNELVEINNKEKLTNEILAQKN